MIYEIQTFFQSKMNLGWESPSDNSLSTTVNLIQFFVYLFRYGTSLTNTENRSSASKMCKENNYFAEGQPQSLAVSLRNERNERNDIHLQIFFSPLHVRGTPLRQAVVAVDSAPRRGVELVLQPLHEKVLALLQDQVLAEHNISL